MWYRNYHLAVESRQPGYRVLIRNSKGDPIIKSDFHPDAAGAFNQAALIVDSIIGSWRR